MAEPPFISPREPDDPGLSYTKLREEGIDIIQALAGDVWTDYNEHDPGVTTLEQLAYALTDLSYRADLPMADLLTGADGRIDTRRQALFVARRIFPVNPVTQNDYRKLIVDRLPFVRNVWLEPYTGPRAINGLYEIWAYAPGADPCACDGALTPEEVRRRVCRTYVRYRDLCEDVHAVRVLRERRTTVHAAVTLDERSTPETVLAEILFEVSIFLAPEIRRRSLDALLAEGRAPGAIFDGPLLRNGFIDDRELGPKAAEIPVQEIIRVMIRTKGVASVRDVWVTVQGSNKVYRGNQSIPVAKRDILALDTAPNAAGDFTIRLFRRGVECKPDPARVKRELDRLFTSYRRTYPLFPEYRERFGVPQGRRRDLARYYSIQNQYPVVYGIGEAGLDEGVPPRRRAQAKQLKGYLLVFEQILTDYFAQLAHTRDLFSTDPTLHQTYFSQSLASSVPHVEPLLSSEYEPGLRLAVASEDPAVERRNRFLDVLLALYADGVSAPSVLGLTCDCPDQGPGGMELVRTKIRLLRHLVASTRDRGRAFDYLGPISPRNVQGMEIRTRIQLGMPVYGGRSLLAALEEAGVDLVDDPAAVSLGRSLRGSTDAIESGFTPATAFEIEPRGAPAAAASGLLRTHAITEDLLRVLGEAERYLVGTLPGDTGFAVVIKPPNEAHYRVLARHPSEREAVTAASQMAEVMHALYHRCQQLYIVEHLMLRFGRFLRRRPAGGEMVYPFTVTAVVSASPGQDDEVSFRETVREVVRQNAPAAVVVEYAFLRPVTMRRFEELYFAWREALRSRIPRRIVRTSIALRTFLEAHTSPPRGPRTSGAW